MGLLVTGILQIVQISLVEYMQRRIFTKAALEFAFRIIERDTLQRDLLVDFGRFEFDNDIPFGDNRTFGNNEHNAALRARQFAFAIDRVLALDGATFYDRVLQRSLFYFMLHHIRLGIGDRFDSPIEFK